MRRLHFDCPTGISGDMTLAALIDIGADLELIKRGVNSLNLPGVELIVTSVMKKGFAAKKFDVQFPPQHVHRHFTQIRDMIEGASEITAQAKKLAVEMFFHIAIAEAQMHGCTVEEVHFHEVGAIDSIVDIVGVAIAIEALKVHTISASPIPTGSGTVKMAHGICPIPAPATAMILQGVPLAHVDLEAELTTPTGAAIIKTLVTEFTSLPAMTIEKYGHGAGTKDLADRPNMLRVFLGESSENRATEEIVLLETNLDDVTPEVLGYTRELLEAAGGLDVYTTPIFMKKNRTAVLLSVICQPEDQTKLEEIVFKQTRTLGIRSQKLSRTVCERHEIDIETDLGSVKGKMSKSPAGDFWFKSEYESCKKIAEETGLPIAQIARSAEGFFDTLSPEECLEIWEHPDTDAELDFGGHHHDHDCEHDHDHDCEHDHDHDHHHDHDH